MVSKIESGDNAAYEEVKRAYANKDPNAAVVFGILYTNGVFFKRDLDKALEYFRWASDNGSQWGDFFQWIFLGNGIRVNRDLPKGIQYLKRAAEKGYVGAQASLSLLSLTGVIKDVDKQKALGDLMAIRNVNDPIVQNVWARVIADVRPEGVNEELSEARRLWESSYRSGYFVARASYAYDLFFGIAGEPDQPRALEVAKPLVGFEPLSTFIWINALYYGKAGLKQQRDEACRLAEQSGTSQQDRMYIRSRGVRTFYGLCLYTGVLPGDRLVGLAHIAKAAGLNEPLAISVLKDIEKKASKDDIEKAKQLIDKLP
jgi:TPR repeat protein